MRKRREVSDGSLRLTRFQMGFREKQRRRKQREERKQALRSEEREWQSERERHEELRLHRWRQGNEKEGRRMKMRPKSHWSDVVFEETMG